nr:DUF1127 domain-containing protein [Pseudomonas sp.]
MDRVLPCTMPAHSSRVTLRRLALLLRLWRQNSRTRRQLASLDERLLADIGISPGERIEELRLPFWR